jgi:hypothetical protein
MSQEMSDTSQENAIKNGSARKRFGITGGSGHITER